MPVWNHTLQIADIFHDDDMPLKEKRDEIVKRIKDAPFFDESDADLIEVVEELAEVDSIMYFDAVWDAFYDWCDDNRVWVATF